MKRINVFWITVLVLGLLFDFLFWGHEPGINFAIYALACLAGGTLVLLLNGNKPDWKVLLLVLPVGFFIAMTFLRGEPMSSFLAHAFTLLLLAVMALSWLGGRWLKYNLADYVVNYAKLAGNMVAGPVKFLLDRRKQNALPKANMDAGDAGATQPTSKPGWKRFWAVVRGIVIAVPVIVVFAALLSSADAVFAGWLKDFVQLFRLEKLPEYIFRLGYILVGACLLAGVFLYAAQKSRDEKLVGEQKPLVPPFLGMTEAMIVLGSVVALFAVFVVIQFSYFFGGQSNIHIEGFTYSEYARRGFGELVAVAFFSLLLFLGLSGITKRSTVSQRWFFSGLGIALVVLVGVMLVSAFQRLTLYESAYGFSRLRLYTHVFIIWLGILLTALVVLEVLRKERAFALSVLLAGIGFAVTLQLVHVDPFIVRKNVARAEAGHTLDVAYLASLSADALPELARSYQDPENSAGTRDAVGASLACMKFRTRQNEDTDWRSFTLARWWGDQAMQTVKGDLKGYKIDKQLWPYPVTTPAGEVYDCYSSGMD